MYRLANLPDIFPVVFRSPGSAASHDHDGVIAANQTLERRSRSDQVLACTSFHEHLNSRS